MESRSGGAVSPHGERAHSRSTGRAHRAAHCGEGDRERDYPRAHLPSGGRRPNPCRSCDGPDALLHWAASPMAALAAPPHSVPRAGQAAAMPAALAPPCAPVWHSVQRHL